MTVKLSRQDKTYRYNKMHFHQYLAVTLPALSSFAFAIPAKIDSSPAKIPRADLTLKTTATNNTRPIINRPRLILYHQTHRDKRRNERHVSLLPLLKNSRLTHIYVGCYHFSKPGFTLLNDYESENMYFKSLWHEMSIFRQKRPDIRFMAMLGGAAGGFFKKLTTDNLQEVIRLSSKKLTADKLLVRDPLQSS
jgi:hypothetical protein